MLTDAELRCQYWEAEALRARAQCDELLQRNLDLAELVSKLTAELRIASLWYEKKGAT